MYRIFRKAELKNVRGTGRVLPAQPGDQQFYAKLVVQMAGFYIGFGPGAGFDDVTQLLLAEAAAETGIFVDNKRGQSDFGGNVSGGHAFLLHDFDQQKLIVLPCQEIKNPHRGFLQGKQIIIIVHGLFLSVFCDSLQHVKNAVVQMASISSRVMTGRPMV